MVELAPWVGSAGRGVEASSRAAVLSAAGAGAGEGRSAPAVVGASPLMPNSFTRVGSTR